jgi:hypothetical protein
MKKDLIFKLLTLLLVAVLASCVQQPEGNDDSSSSSSSSFNDFDDLWGGSSGSGYSTSTNTNTYTPSPLSESYNFFTYRGESKTSVHIPSNFSDTVYLRGNEVSNTLFNIYSSQNYACILFPYPTSKDKRYLAVSAKYRLRTDYSTNKQEYYFQLNFNSSTIENECNSSTIISALNSVSQLSLSEDDISFGLDELCPTCSSSISSQGLYMVDKSGNAISGIATSYLRLYVDPTASTITDPLACTSSTTCLAKGYNCCLNGQCVKDREVKPGVDTNTSEFMNISTIVANNPEAFRDYPEYYYVCPINVPNDGGSTTTNDPIKEAQLRLNRLYDLYQCLNPQVDEMSICSLRYENASSLMSDPEEGYTFEAAIDDLNFAFTGVMDGSPNIVEVNYGGQVLYKEGEVEDNEKVALDEDSVNDDLDSAQSVTVTGSLPLNPLEDVMTIKYRVDGSCERLNGLLTRCIKTYVQGQSSEPARPSDHEDGDQTFLLPSYIDTEYNIIVRVNGVNIPQSESTWEAGDEGIEFSQTIYPNQKVEIIYFVSEDSAESLTISKNLAQEAVNQHCNCSSGSGSCNLEPVYDESVSPKVLKSFNCKYPQNTITNPPLQQVAYVSGKSVPHRFFDENGINYDTNYFNATSTEGTEFKYINNSTMYPNNLSEEYVGFNEIYGSFLRTSDSARPPEVIPVKKGRTYNLYVDLGSFSSCINCGSDYYSSLATLFPQNFQYMGGGYKPDTVETRRFDNVGQYRADDLLFGRACFLPATMIPFAHVANDDVQTQRLTRLATQHFYFANGYSRDWYGFDYGSLIGSFDGVSWFAIGNQRRIQAKTNKLFLAVNAYFGDLTQPNDFKVVVSELTTTSTLGVVIDHDSETTGAECQKRHFCSTDADCISNLGYEYSCEAVSGIATPWPVFDNNANEIPGESQVRLLSSIIGGTNGQTKRCVYRGRGAACLPDPYSADDSYSQTTTVGLHMCSQNTYCQAFEEESEVYNTKISRIGRSPVSQNNDEDLMELISPADTFGLSARIIGRPFNFYGSESPAEEITAQLGELSVPGICIPGKNTGEDSHSGAHASAPDEARADRTLNIGVTPAEEFSANYYSVCPVVDEEGNNPHKGSESKSFDDEEYRALVASQNMSSNLLKLDALSSLGIFNDDEDQITSAGLNASTCLRAPGATCFTDLDCAPSKFIADKVSRLQDIEGLNDAEKAFWAEGLICGQNKPKYLPNTILMNPDYDVSANKCCREVGNTITVFSATHEEATFYADKIAGYDEGEDGEISITDEKRYSRVHTVYDKLKSDAEKYPSLVGPKNDPDEKMEVEKILRQYNTFHLAATRTCCSGHWVRNFAEDNGGDNSWVEGRHQRIKKEAFKCISWENDNGVNGTGFNLRFECHPENWESVECEIKNLSGAEQDKYLKWLEKFELTGIPQIPIETQEAIHCLVDEDSQLSNADDKKPLTATIKEDASPEFTDGDNDYLSAGDMENFETGEGEIKKVFSDNKVTCCQPSGVQVDNSVTDEMCCTGKVFKNKCCLEDYTDISVYLNRYVSSEAAYLSDSQIDPATGYIIDPGTVMQIAQQKGLCCSGKMSYGYAIHQLLIPGVESQSEAKVTRFIYSDGTTDNNSETGNIGEIYNKGVRWNNHVYCVPSSFQEPDGD